MQKIQHAITKTHTFSKRRKIYEELYFMVEGYTEECSQNLQLLKIQNVYIAFIKIKTLRYWSNMSDTRPVISESGSKMDLFNT